MSTAFTAGGATQRPRPTRHALGLPAGSVRALLAIGILAMLWLLVLRPGTGEEGKVISGEAGLVFVYLNMLMILVLVNFFTAHGKTIGPQVSDRSPLGLPRGSVRFLLMAGYLGLAYFLYKTQPKFEIPDTGAYALPLALLMTGYFLGHIISGLLTRLGGGLAPPWYQDFEAWISIVALFGLGILILVRLVINKSVPLEDRLDMQMLETILAAIIGFYVGARS
jgi:hypothetical protein